MHCQPTLLQFLEMAGREMIKRAKGIFPYLEEIILLKDSKHVPSSKDIIISYF